MKTLKKTWGVKICGWMFLLFCWLNESKAQLPLLNGLNGNDQVLTDTNVSGFPQNSSRTKGSGIPEWPPAKVRIGYVVPSNRTPQANYKENLQFAIEMAQMWFRNNMQQNGFGPKTFIFETESDSPRPKIHLVNVPETDDYLRGNSGGELYERTRFAAKNAGLSIDLEGEMWVLIPETHLQKSDGSFVGGIAMGGGGGSGNHSGTAELGSTVIQLFNPARLLDNTNYAGQIIPELGPYPLVDKVSFAWFEGHTFSSVASSYLGALLHEMGHAFGINHDFRHDSNFFGGLMGNGLRGIRGSFFPALYPTDYTRLEYGSSLMLNESYFFNRTRKASFYGPNVSILTNGSVNPTAGLLNIHFTASDADSLSYAHLYDNYGQLIDEMLLSGFSIDTIFKTPYFNAGRANTFYLSVGNRQGNRKVSSAFTLNVAAGNQAPKPFLKVLFPNAPYANNNTLFDASATNDPNGDAYTTEIDFNNDGVFDTPPLLVPTYYYGITQTGPYLSRIRVIDTQGAAVTSSPISGNYGKNCALDAPVIEGVSKICTGATTKLTAYGCYGTLEWSNGATSTSIVVSPTSSTTYTVTCRYGCEAQTSLPFTVNMVEESAILSNTTPLDKVQIVGQSLTSTQQIPKSNHLTYLAGNSITLLPNFEAQNGSVFSAILKGCSQPVAYADKVTSSAGVSKIINVLSNDLNPDGSAVTNLTQLTLPTIVVNPSKGTVMVNEDGTVSYLSNESSGTDTFVYSVCNKNNPSACTSATVSVDLQMYFSFLYNGGFEGEVDFLGGHLYLAWEKGGWKPNQAVFSWLRGQGRNGSNCIKIYSGPASGIAQSNDVYAYQTVLLKPYTNYVLKGWVKTQDISTNANSGGVGGSLCVMTSINSADFPPRSKDLKGSNDWTELVLPFNSGDGYVKVMCRLGYTAADSEGTAYFDDLTLERLN